MSFNFSYGTLVLLACLIPALANAKALITPEEALSSLFPSCEAKRENVFLTQGQVERVRVLSGKAAPSALITRLNIRCDGKPAGTAYIDVHRVRTHNEGLLIALDSNGSVKRIEVLTFDEPTDYIPRGEWYARFQGAQLNDELQLKRRIPPVTGASLTVRSTTEATRRILAIDQVLRTSEIAER